MASHSYYVLLQGTLSTIYLAATWNARMKIFYKLEDSVLGISYLSSSLDFSVLWTSLLQDLHRCFHLWRHRIKYWIVRVYISCNALTSGTCFLNLAHFNIYMNTSSVSGSCWHLSSNDMLRQWGPGMGYTLGMEHQRLEDLVGSCKQRLALISIFAIGCMNWVKSFKIIYKRDV